MSASCRRSFDLTPASVPAHTAFPLPGDTVHLAPDRTAMIRHLCLELSAFDFAKRSFEGAATLTLAPIGPTMTGVTLDAVDFDVTSVEGVMGVPVEHAYDGRHLVLRFPTPIQEGDSAVVTVRYRCRPARGLYFNQPDAQYPDRPRQIWTQGQDQDARHWFPCHDDTNMKHTVEVIATVPAGFFALSNGALLSRTPEPNAGTEAFHWSESSPMPAYLVTLAAGEFTELTDEAEGVPLQYYAQRGREEECRRALARTPAMMRFFIDRLACPFPFEKYAQVFVADFIFGGMENVSATTLTDVALYDERAALDYHVDGLVAHELAHQWFGDLLTCREWASGWLNEGFATYWQALFTEHDRGADEFAMELWENATAYLEEDESRYRRPIVEHTYRGPLDIFDRHLYEKGSLVLHMVRYILGDEGFFRAMRHYLRANANGNVTTADLRRAIEDTTGKNLDQFLDQWVHKGGHPEYEVEWSWDGNAGQARVTVKQTQATDALTPLFRMPVELAFHGNWGEKRVRVPVEEREHAFFMSLPARPHMVRFDPENAILKKVTFDKSPVELVEQLRADPHPAGRMRAAQGLGKLGTRAALDALVTAVRTDSFWGVQAEAARALGEMRTDSARNALIELLTLEHPKARRGVVDALGQFRGDERAAEALLSIVRDGDPSYFVEGEAAKSLGRTRSPRAHDALVAALSTESWNQTIRSRVLEGLGELGDKRALPVVLEWTESGRPQPARVAAIGALEKLAKGDDAAIDRLVALLDDPWLRVVTRAAQVLGALRAETAMTALERVVARHGDPRAVRNAREALRDIRSAQPGSAGLEGRLDLLEKENRDLRARLAAVEDRLGSGVIPTGSTAPMPADR